MNNHHSITCGIVLNPQALAKPEAVQVKPFLYDPGYGLYVYYGRAAHFVEWQTSEDGNSAWLVDRMVVQGDTRKRIILPHELVRRWVSQFSHWLSGSATELPR